MDLQRWITSTLDIQAIPSPTFDEAERAAHMQRAFEAAGLEQVHQDQLGNVYACVPGGAAPAILVSAHLDSVFDRDTDLHAKRTQARITAPGIGDNAVALGALLELAEDLRADPPAGDLWLVANVGEEGLGNLNGMREVVSQLEGQVSAYLVLEGMAFGHICHRALPARRYRLSATTRGGHSWLHRGRASAVHGLLRLGQALLELELPGAPNTSLNIGTIQGGRSINSIADAASFELDLRSESERALEQLDRSLQGLVRGAASDQLGLELELIGVRPGGQLPTDHPLVQAAVDSLHAVGEHHQHLEAGSTDASVPLQRSLPAVCVGLTRGGEAHTLREYIELGPMADGYRALRELIDRAFSIDS